MLYLTLSPTSHYSQAHSGIEDYELEVSMTPEISGGRP
jgi:hypothetical protein